MKIVFGCLSICLLGLVAAHAQQDSSASWLFTGYAETYYNFDFNSTTAGERPSFVYNHKKTGTVSINLALLKMSYQTKRFRSNVGLMAGTYVTDNLGSEPRGLRNLYEANAGIKLSKKRNIWLDAGILPSHLGLATPIGKDNWALTRSLASENTPYYETGVRVGYTPGNEKWFAALLLINGWQRIQRPNSTFPSLGTQLSYKPSKQWLINSSTYIGNERNALLRERWRLFHNLYTVYQPITALGLVACFDIGAQQYNSSGQMGCWYASYLQTKYSFTRQWSSTLRAEYYHDPRQLLVSTDSPGGFQTMGYSLNVDYYPFQQMVLRLEGKLYQSKDALFTNQDGSTTPIYSGMTLALAAWF
jgi:hypothetical protein